MHFILIHWAFGGGCGGDGIAADAETLGAIVGGVVGGVALLCIVVVVMVIIRSRKKKASPPTTAAAEMVKPQMVAIDSIPMGKPVA